MEKIDLTYLQNEIAEQSALQLKQLIQNDGKAIVDAINKQLKEAADDDIIFALSHSIKIDLGDMKIKGKLGFSVKRSTELETAIHDPENPEFDFGTNTDGHGQGASGAPLVPAGEIPRELHEQEGEFTCSRCGEKFDNEGDGEDHLNGQECEKPE